MCKSILINSYPYFATLYTYPRLSAERKVPKNDGKFTAANNLSVRTYVHIPDTNSNTYFPLLCTENS